MLKIKSDSEKRLSSFYEKYLEIKRSYPDYVVAYRLGDFYEVFGEKAVQISEECNLTLTGRDVGLETRIPMVGFPYHVAESLLYRPLTRIPIQRV